MAKEERVQRPIKASEYEIRCASVGAQRGWRDLLGVQKNALTDAWDELTREPLTSHEKKHPMRDKLQFVRRNGHTHERWQLSLAGGARVWYYVSGRIVYLEQVHTQHPNKTK